MKPTMYSCVILMALYSNATASELEKLRLGAALTGVKPEMTALKGKAVFVELWGVH